LHLLTNLCRLEFTETRVVKVPPHLGKLKNLKVVMNSFKVGHGKEFGIQRLGELNNLHEGLSIGELQNIENSLDAIEANLKNKTLLVNLNLRWGRNGNSIDSKEEENVIENLQPSKNLKELSIFNYGGKKFPNWLLNNSLLNLVSLVLSNCQSCHRFPPLGLLPFLKKLEISGCDEIVSIDADFHGNKSSSFKSLQTLYFSNMRQWEKWECKVVTGAFQSLHRLSISSCPKLKGQLPEQVVPLETLHIRYCQQLEASAPRALHLELYDCGKLKLDWITMKSLTMGGHNMEASLLEMIGSDTLERLEIEQSICDDSVSLKTFPLDCFPTLKTLNLNACGNLHLISQDRVHNHLKDLTIKECLQFESLPRNMRMLLPSLRYLWIQHCPRLETFNDGGLPSNLEHLIIIKCSELQSLPANMHMLLLSLTRLWIEDCPRIELFPNGGLPSNLEEMKLNNCSRLVGSLKGAFRDRSSLESLWIEELDAKCFPDEGLLPFSLTSLTIRDCSNLEKLDYKGLYQLSSLKLLILVNCPNLQCLPEEGLPRSISDLCITNCSLLEQRCQKEGGEDWEKIAHIRNLHIL